MIHSSYPEGERSEEPVNGDGESQAQWSPEAVELASDEFDSLRTTEAVAEDMISEGAPVGAPPPTATLTLKRQGAVSDVKFVLSPPAVIGRFDPSRQPVEVDLGVLEEGRYVSRSHARIDFEDGAWTIQDLGSANGTYVYRSADNKFERVENAVIRAGDLIALGNAQFVFDISATEAPNEEPPADPIVNEGDAPQAEY